MSYTRKTSSASELSEACRRAALSRKSRGGGRKTLPGNDVPQRGIKVCGRDYDVLCAAARSKNTSIKGVVHLLAGLVVLGGTAEAHPDFAPDGWAL